MHKCKMFSLLVHMIAVYLKTVQALLTPSDVVTCLKNRIINIIKKTYIMFF